MNFLECWRITIAPSKIPGKINRNLGPTRQPANPPLRIIASLNGTLGQRTADFITDHSPLAVPALRQFLV